jgi:hypothetical protein
LQTEEKKIDMKEPTNTNKEKECNQCTFKNEPNAKICKMCDTKLTLQTEEKKIDMKEPTNKKEMDNIKEPINPTNKKEMDDIKKQLGNRFNIINVLGDGACLFRSLTHQLKIEEEYYDEIRLGIYCWLQNNYKIFPQIEYDDQQFIPNIKKQLYDELKDKKSYDAKVIKNYNQINIDDMSFQKKINKYIRYMIKNPKAYGSQIEFMIFLTKHELSGTIHKAVKNQKGEIRLISQIFKYPDNRNNYDVNLLLHQAKRKMRQKYL